jgi:Fe-S cluster assembly iron-binding protein IscA
VLYVDGNGLEYVIDLDRGVFAVVDQESREALNEYSVDYRKTETVEESSWEKGSLRPAALSP